VPIEMVELQMATAAPSPALKPSPRPTLLKLCGAALYVGTVGYGGPAILAQMKRTFVDERAWLSERDFMDALSLAQILPGATGVSLMGYIGHKLRSPWGGILVPVCFVLPAAVLMLVASWAYFRYQGIKAVQSLFTGLGALVVALLVNATLKLGQSVFKRRMVSEYRGVLIAVIAFLGFYFERINVIVLTVGAGMLGLVFYYSANDSEHHDAAKGHFVAPGRKSDAVRKPYVALLVTGLIAFSMICFPLPRRIFATFFGIGTFAFGGGFAAIPLIQSRIVSQLHWLSLAQFRDGIALGQVTPGPVFITATFIGYKVMGFVGALVATVAIFMPSLAGMIALSEVHNAIRHLKPIRAIIRGFLAGFIGLLVAVTVQFAVKSLVGWQTWLIFCSSLALILYYKKDVLWAIAGTVVASLVLFQ
jgi:chromate transporter